MTWFVFSTKNVDCKIKSSKDKKLNNFKEDLQLLSVELAKKLFMTEKARISL